MNEPSPDPGEAQPVGSTRRATEGEPQPLDEAPDGDSIEADADVAPDERQEPLVIVGIGASAGGLEALKQFVAGLPLSDSLTYVVAQHLSPTHTSLLAELLKPETALTLLDVQDGVTPLPNAIYVTPPNQNVEVVNGRLHLVKPSASVGPKPSVDHLFQSMADGNGENAVGIVLSGTGSDGAAGIRAIKAAGGITLVQDPETAKYDGMPRAAIQTGVVDRVLPASRMGELIESIVATPARLSLPPEESERAGAYTRITATVKRVTGFDLNHYKRTTINRRVLRRMGLHKCQSIEAYAEITQKDPAEASALAKDVLISVTSFFRDKSAFEALRRNIETMVREREGTDVIRVWVAGCATGEEAYSIAMCLSEAIHEMPGSAPEFLVFATDIDTEAVGFARNGVYPETSVEGLPRRLRERYFESNGRVYQVKKNLRQSMVFAAQNVIEDPPFSRMDLISCRNLLIYLNRSVQRRVLEIFHYALRPRGLVFLGKSESIELHKELFEDLDKKSRIFRRRETIVSHYAVPLRSRDSSDEERGSSASRRSNDPLTASYRLVNAIAEQLAPPSVIVNDSDEVIHFNGDLKPFLRFPRGPADLKVFELVHEEVRGELRALIHRARRENTQQSGNAFRARLSESDEHFACHVSPLVVDKQSLVVVAFEKIEATPATLSDAADSTSSRDGLIIEELERELANTRSHLQTVVEELETTNEELLSQSEELQSANEELQSTNEELQTSNEELQSTNEELMTVNDELQSKSHELTVIASDLEAVKQSIDSPLLVVNERLQISHFNEAANRSLPKDDLQPGMSVASVDWYVGMVEIMPRIREVARSGRVFETRMQDERGRQYIVRITASTGFDNQTNSAILLFVDVSEQIAEQATLKEREAIYSLVFDLSAVGTVLLDRDLSIRQANQALGQLFEVPQGELLTRKFPDLFVESYHQLIRDLLEDLFTGKRRSIIREMEVRSARGVPIWVNFTGIAIEHSDEQVTRVFVQLQDITAAKRRQQELHAERLRLHMHAHIAGLSDYDRDEVRLLNDIARVVFTNVPSSRVSVTIRTDNDELRVVASRQTDGIPSVAGVQLSSASARQLIASLESARGRNAGERRVETFEGGASSAPSQDWLGSRALDERINLPLFEENRVVGFLSVERLQGQQFDIDEQDALRSVAELVALKMKELRTRIPTAGPDAGKDAGLASSALKHLVENLAEVALVLDADGLCEAASSTADALFAVRGGAARCAGRVFGPDAPLRTGESTLAELAAGVIASGESLADLPATFRRGKRQRDFMLSVVPMGAALAVLVAREKGDGH